MRSARRGQLLSRIAWLAKRNSVLDEFPEKVQHHLQSALQVAESQARSVHWEIKQIQQALGSRQIPFIVLKGAAYIKANLDAGHGRLMSDVDIMVPRPQLDEAERTLFDHGWFPTKLNAYDQRYYRTWMHELPPMQNLKRGTSLDVHHTILPPTALLKPNPEKLWQSAIPIEAEPYVHILAPIDMILHSAAHLFHEGEMEHGLRDLVDIDALLGQFSGEANFWNALFNRAIELDLSRPLHYALHYCCLFLATPIPELALTQYRQLGSPGVITRLIMDSIVPTSVGAILKTRVGLITNISRFWIYVRSHYLRMPMYLLIPHLLRKQFKMDSD